MADELDALTSEGANRERRGAPRPSTPAQQGSQVSASAANLPPELAALVAMTQATLGNQDQSSNDFDLLVDRRITGPTTQRVRQTYVSNPRMDRPVQAPRLTAQNYGEQRVVRDEEAFVRGSIEEDRTGLNDLVSAGFLGNTNQDVQDAVILAANGDPDKYESVFRAAASTAALRQKAGESRVSMLDVLGEWTKNGLPESLSGGSRGGGGGGAFSSTQTQVTLTNEGTARRIINDALSRELGRAASKDELNKFLKTLNVNEKENPTITKTQGYSSGGSSTSSSTTTGGFDSMDFAERFARSQEGYAEYQAATTYMDAFINALESDSRVI